MAGSTVENAQTGVWCAKELANFQTDGNYYGGWFRSASNNTFRNNIYGVRITDYKRIGSNGVQLPNRCYITDTEFETTLDWRIWQRRGTI